MNLPDDLTGKIFGRLTAVRLVSGRPARWECLCACGATKIVYAKNIKCGTTKSCGCLSREETAARSVKHGACNSRLYTIWRGMLARTQNPRKHNYKYYGERGIVVCNEWLSFGPFKSWAINCRWVTVNSQARNKRTTKLSVEDVTSIRADSRATKEIAAAHGVAAMHINAIKRHARWKDV